MAPVLCAISDRMGFQMKRAVIASSAFLFVRIRVDSWFHPRRDFTRLAVVGGRGLGYAHALR